jgi:small nuclear ribonucleoprotein (snRNP)-like protein
VLVIVKLFTTPARRLQTRSRRYHVLFSENFDQQMNMIAILWCSNIISQSFVKSKGKSPFSKFVYKPAAIDSNTNPVSNLEWHERVMLKTVCIRPETIIINRFKANQQSTCSNRHSRENLNCHQVLITYRTNARFSFWADNNDFTYNW